MARCRILDPTEARRIEPWDWSGPSGSPPPPGAGGGRYPKPARGPFTRTDSRLAEEDERPSLEQVKEEAYQEGFTAGRAAAEQGLRNRFAEVAKALLALETVRDRIRREAENDQVAIALAVARRILRREIHLDPLALKGLVSAAMEKLQGQKILRVIADPTLREGLAQALQEVAAGDAVDIVCDPALEPGSLLFETSRGRLDGSFESQLSEIESGLIDRLNRV
jgi:flagellar assembly protein FliH